VVAAPVPQGYDCPPLCGSCRGQKQHVPRGVEGKCVRSALSFGRLDIFACKNTYFGPTVET